MIDILLTQLAPIFIAIAIGTVFGRTIQPDLRTLSRAALYIFSPCLVISSLTNSQLTLAAFGQVAFFAVVVIVLVGGITLLVARLMGFNRTLTTALLLATMFANTGNYGLSLNLFAFGEDALAYAVIYYITSTFMVFSLGIFIASSGRSSLSQSLVELMRMPPTYALFISAMLMGFGWQLPVTLQRPIDLLGQAAIPVMLILLGIQISSAKIPRQLSWIGLATGLRLLVAPSLAIGLAALFSLNGTLRQASIVEASMPTAVITTLLAIEYDTEPTLLTGTVLLSTLLSPITLTPLLAWLS